MKITMRVELDVPDDMSMQALADAISHMAWSLRDLDQRVCVKDLRINDLIVMLPDKLVWR